MEKMGNDVESCQLLRPARGREGRREGKDGPPRGGGAWAGPVRGLRHSEVKYNPKVV